MKLFRTFCSVCKCEIPFNRAALHYTTCIDCSDTITKKRWMYFTTDEYDCTISHLTYETTRKPIQLREEDNLPYPDSDDIL